MSIRNYTWGALGSLIILGLAGTLDAGQVDVKLVRAVRADFQQAAERLLAEGASVEAADTEGTTVLMWAALNGNRSLFENLLKAGAEPRRSRPDGYTVLMAAAEGGNREIFEEVRTVLDQAASLAARTAEGETVLHAAARGGSAAIVRELLQVGIDPAVADARGRTALHWTAGESARASIALLLKAGADPNTVDERGETPVHLVLEYLNSCGVKRPYSREDEKRLVQAEESLRLLLVHGGDPDRADEAGQTAAHRLAAGQFPELVPMLRAANTDFTRKNAEGLTALDIARKASNPRMVRVLEAEMATDFLKAARTD